MTIKSIQLPVSHNANFINWTIKIKEYDLILDRKTGELAAKISDGFNEETGEEITEAATIEQLVKENNISFVLLPNGEELSLINKREYFNRAADHYYLTHSPKSYEELKKNGYLEFKRKSWAGDCREDDWKTMEEAFACGVEKARITIAEEQKTDNGRKDEKYTVVEWDGTEWIGIAKFESTKQVEEFVSRARTELSSIRTIGEMRVCTNFNGIYPGGASIFSNIEDSVKASCK
jgi:hypothetical protein